MTADSVRWGLVDAFSELIESAFVIFCIHLAGHVVNVDLEMELLVEHCTVTRQDDEGMATPPEI